MGELLLLPDDVIKILQRKFKSKHRQWLVNSELSLEINLGIPTEQEAAKQPEGCRNWIAAWQSWKGGGSLVWCERNWRSLGRQNVPQKLMLKNPSEIAALIGEAENWEHAVKRFNTMVNRWPALVGTLPKHYNVLSGYSDPDFLRLIEILSWLCANPSSGLYIRQIPVAGIDSKWLESRKGLVSELIAAIQNESKPSITSNEKDFFNLCGLKNQPKLIRMRMLNSNLRNNFNGLSDITAPLEEIASLDITPSFVFIIENHQTALAFSDLANTIVIMGLGSCTGGCKLFFDKLSQRHIEPTVRGTEGTKGIKCLFVTYCILRGKVLFAFYFLFAITTQKLYFVSVNADNFLRHRIYH